MSLSGFTEYKSKLANPFQRITAHRYTFGWNATTYTVPTSYQYDSSVVASMDTPVNEVCNDQSPWDMRSFWASDTFTWKPNARSGSGSQYLGRSVFNANDAITSGSEYGEPWAQGFIVLIDRLVQQGGLVGNVTTPQTTNFPTVALPRYTDGVGVWAAFERRTPSFGTTLSSWSISYTNSDGTAGRTSQAAPTQQFSDIAGLTQVASLQAGDVGIKSIESFTNTVNTGGGGSALSGMILFKPLLIIPMNKTSFYEFEPLEAMRFVELKNGACLQWLYWSTNESLMNPDIICHLETYE